MHSNVTINDVSCSYFSWALLYKLKLFIVNIINGRENKCAAVIILTCKAILTSRPVVTSNDLQTSRLGFS